MTYLAIIVMMLMAFAVVGWPLISPSRRNWLRPDGDSRSDDLISKRDAAYQAIKDLDFEYELGNLSESDHTILRQRYRSDAAAALQKLDAADEGARSGHTPSATSAASSGEPTMGSSQAAVICASCGTQSEAGDNYCAGCGAEVGRSCRNCASPAHASDRFCAACGTPLEGTA